MSDLADQHGEGPYVTTPAAEQASTATPGAGAEPEAEGETESEAEPGGPVESRGGMAEETGAEEPPAFP